jgi:pyridoxal phosphate enzyme (YggS family)
MNHIKEAAIGCGRDPKSIRLVGVSKTVPPDRVKEAIDAGVTIVGENYVQEAREKVNALAAYDVSWHFIGHLQSNKAKYVVRLFDLIHSIDSFKLARELNKQAHKINKIQNILIQVNIAQESAKSGADAEAVFELINGISALNNLRVRGLMTLPPFFNAPEKVRPYFSALRDLQNQLQKHKWHNVDMQELSMGMTGDFQVAIEEGATLVRIGTAIFGKRK